MPAIVAQNTLGLARGAGGVQDIERVGRQYGDTIRLRAIGLRALNRIHPVEIASGDHPGRAFGALQHQAGIGLVRREFDRPIQQRLVGHDPARFQPA